MLIEENGFKWCSNGKCDYVKVLREDERVGTYDGVV